MGKPRYVFDATPLIYLAKVGLLEIALDSCDAYTVESVEIETTKDSGYPDAIKIRDCIENGHLKIHHPSVANVEALSRHVEIHRGEAEVLAAAKELEAFAIIDDKEARSVAEIYKIRTHPGSLFVLFELVAKERIDASFAEGKLEQMVVAGLYLDSRTLIIAKNKLQDLR